MTTRKKIDFLINIAFIGVCLILFYLTVKYLLHWCVPFIIAMIIAAALQRPIRYTAKRTKFKERFCAVIFVTLTLLILGFLIFIAGYQIVGDLSSFFVQISNFVTDRLPEYNSNTQLLDGLIANLPANISEPLEQISGIVSADVTNIIKNIALSAGSSIASFTTKIPGLLVSFIITIVATFFFCMDYQKIKTFLRLQIPVKKRAALSEVKNYMVTTIFRMLRSYLIIMCITFTELSIGFLLMRINYAIIIAGIIAIVDILPVLGVGTVLIPWCIICFISGDWVMGIQIVILYIVIAAIRNTIEPKIVGTQIGLNPIVTLVAMYLGLQTFGVLGMFLFPLTIILLARLQATGLIHFWNTKDKEQRTPPQDNSNNETNIEVN